jgi:uncharacterized protein (DUF952 family)
MPDSTLRLRPAQLTVSADVSVAHRFAGPIADDPATSRKRESGPLRTIYKICDAPAWCAAERAGVYRGSADDSRDGFIHFSTAAQLDGTLAKHYAGKIDLKLIAVDAEALGEGLRWEPSRGGELFPHLYGELALSAVTGVHDILTRPDGRHDIPELAP